MPDCSNFLDNNGQQEAHRWAKSLTRETFASSKQHVIIQAGWLIVIIIFNSTHSFTGCMWNSSFIQPETGTVPEGLPKGKSLCQRFNQRAIPLPVSDNIQLLTGFEDKSSFV